MKIKLIGTYSDGGTISIITDTHKYCVDDRLFSETKGKIYLGYPNKDNSNLIDNQDEIKKEILESITNSEYEKIIKGLLL